VSAPELVASVSEQVVSLDEHVAASTPGAASA